MSSGGVRVVVEEAQAAHAWAHMRTPDLARHAAGATLAEEPQQAESSDPGHPCTCSLSGAASICEMTAWRDAPPSCARTSADCAVQVVGRACWGFQARGGQRCWHQQPSFLAVQHEWRRQTAATPPIPGRQAASHSQGVQAASHSQGCQATTKQRAPAQHTSHPNDSNSPAGRTAHQSRT